MRWLTTLALMRYFKKSVKYYWWRLLRRLYRFNMHGSLPFAVNAHLISTENNIAIEVSLKRLSNFKQTPLRWLVKLLIKIGERAFPPYAFCGRVRA